MHPTKNNTSTHTYLDFIDSWDGNDASESTANEVVRPLHFGANLLRLHLYDHIYIYNTTQNKNKLSN